MPEAHFIATEALGRAGEEAEARVWTAVRQAFAERECLAYWRYPIFSRTGETRKELAISKVGQTLVLKTSGKRQYAAEIPLSDDFDVDQITTTLRNGILALTIPKGAQ